CAIGHERDQSVIDMVANESFGTPSKVAQFIENTILGNAKEIIQLFDHIQKIVFQALDAANMQLNHLGENIARSLEYQLAKSTQTLIDQKKSINTDIFNLLSRAQTSAEYLYKLILAN